MPSIDIAASYDRIAHVWDSPAFDRSNGIAAHERALQILKVTGPALDVGCGCSGRFFVLLQARGLTVEGVDVSAGMVERSRKASPGIPVHRADIRSWQLPRDYAFISAWDSLWHVPLADQPAVIGKLCSGLTVGGVIVFSAGGTDGPDERVDHAMGVPMYHGSLGIPRILDCIAQTGCIPRHLEYDQQPSEHVFVIAEKP